MSRSKGKGTWAETAVVEYASYSGFTYADRLPLSGGRDRGDVGLCPGVICEVKNCKEIDLAAWLKETAKEKKNAKAKVGFLVMKPVGVGRTRIGDWLSVMYRGEWLELMMSAPAALLNPPPDMDRTVSGRGYKLVLENLARTDWDGFLTISAIGAEDDRYWYVVTRLSRQLKLLRHAGYGQEVALT